MNEQVHTTVYEIRIAGSIDRSVLHDLDGLDVAPATTETVLRGPLRDQAELHGVLHRLRSSGARLLEVRRLG